MKGRVKITVEVTNEFSSFPVKETFTIARDNTYDEISEWIGVFRKILYLVGFAHGTITDVLEEE